MTQRTAEAETRLQAAFEAEELRALRVAAIARALSIGIIGVWLGIQNPFPGVLYFWGLLVLFVAAGWLPYEHRRRGQRWRWPRYVYPAADAVLLAFALISRNPIDPEIFPFPMALRFSNEVYFFVIIASTVFYYSPRVVIWSGLCAAAAWSAGTLWIAFLPTSEIWSAATMAALPSPEAQIAYVMDPQGVSLTRLAQEAIVFLIVAGILAAVVERSRALVWGHAEAERERSNLARHFSPNMVEELSNMDEPLGAARSQEVAVLFADVVGFTGLAETQPPEKVLVLLREVLGLMAKRVFHHQGTLDKYLGDGIMATFGTPNTSGDDARNALACAHGIVDDVVTLNERRAARGEDPVAVGVGVHFGPVVLGDVGDETRLEFAVVGDTVNVASRFERLTRELGVRLVASGDLASAVGGGDAMRAEGLAPGAPQQVRGRSKPVAVWTL